MAVVPTQFFSSSLGVRLRVTLIFSVDREARVCWGDGERVADAAAAAVALRGERGGGRSEALAVGGLRFAGS
jgi:hypothetical protein